MLPRKVSLLLLSCLLLLSPFAYAEDKEIEAEGRAKIFAGNTTKAHDEAVVTALKEVIKSASAIVLGDESYKKNEKDVAKRVLASYKRYINWHGIVSENYTESEAIIKVKASVSLDKLRADLAPLLSTTPTPEKPAAKKVLLLQAPIPPEEFAKPVQERTVAPIVPSFKDQTLKALKESGYEVAEGGNIGPADTFIAIGERAKAAGAQMAVVLSPVGGLTGSVSVVKVSCAQISTRLFVIGQDGADSGKLEASSSSCDASQDKALQSAGDAASIRLAAQMKRDNRFNAAMRKQLKVTAIPSFSMLENVQRQLQAAAGKGVELMAIDGGAAVFSLPAVTPINDVTSRLAGLLGPGTTVKNENGTAVVQLSYARVFAEGVTDEKVLGFLFDILSKTPGVTYGSAPALPNADGTAEIWLWSSLDAQSFAATISAQTLFGRTLTATVNPDGSIRLIVGPSKLGEKKETKIQ